MPSTGKTVRVADYLFSAIADCGVDHVFMLPGGGAMHLNDGLVCEKRLTPVHCHHEQACGIAAEAYGRIRENFGVCVVTSGPGATNVLTPVSAAWIESIPMMVISGQVKRPDLLNSRALRQGGVQEVDIVPMVRSVTKYAVTIDDPLQVRYHLERALYEMLSGRAGPVWLDVPLDVQAAMIDPASLPGFTPPAAVGTNLSTSAKEAIALLAQAERPLILAGHGVRLAGAARALLTEAERLQVPVTTTWNALDIIPAEHPLYAGRPGVVALRPGNFAVQNCDLLISIGCRLDNIITAYNPQGFARAAKKIVVDVDQNEIDKLDMDITLGVAADAGDFLAALATVPSVPAPGRYAAWHARCKDWKQRYPVNDGKPFPSAGTIDHYHFVSVLSDAIPSETLIATGSSGLAVEVFYTVFQNKPGQRVFLTSGMGAMGYGLPAAIGACFANGKKPMMAIESDGSLQLNIQELATMKAQNLPICLVIMNNGGYASIRNTQRNYFAGRYVGTGPESGLMMPDLELVANTYGLPFQRITDAAELTSVLHEVAANPRAMIVDVQLTPNEVLAPKCAALPQPDGAMLSMPLEDMSPLLSLEQLQAEMSIPLHPASLSAQR